MTERFYGNGDDTKTRSDQLATLIGISPVQAEMLIQYLDFVKRSGFGHVAINIKRHESYNVTMSIDGPPDDKIR